MTTIEVNGIHLSYQLSGHGPLVLLLHGLGSSSADWQQQVRALEDDHRVLRCDLRGHGDSEKPAGRYDIALFAEDVAQLLRRVDAGPADVVGISMGGMIALQLAVDHPELVRRLVIVNTGAEVVPRSLAQRLMVWQRLLMARLLPMTSTAGVVAKRLFPKPEQDGLRQQFESSWGRNDRGAYFRSLQAIVGWSVIDALGEVEQPTLYVSGDRDYTPLAVKEQCAMRMPDARVALVEDSGHATPIDQPEVFNELVLNFLATKVENAAAPALRAG